MTDQEKRIAYVCDRKRCKKCSYPKQCHHTLDIEHAANFEEVEKDHWMEKELTYCKDCLHRKWIRIMHRHECDIFDCVVRKWDYCSWAERKEK